MHHTPLLLIEGLNSKQAIKLLSLPNSYTSFLFLVLPYWLASPIQYWIEYPNLILNVMLLLKFHN